MVTPGATTVAFAVPSAATVKFGMSPGVRAFRILQAVMLHVRIEVAAGGRERRAFALGHRVHVDGVLARRKIHQVQFNVHALRGRRKFRRAHALSLRVVELHLDRFCADAEKASENASAAVIAIVLCSRIGFEVYPNRSSDYFASESCPVGQASACRLCPNSLLPETR